MTVDNNTIESLPDFLAHAIAMEEESAERYETLADSMEVHNNEEVASVFRKLMRYSEKHGEEVRALAAGMSLPEIAPWEFNWSGEDIPEAADCSGDGVHYMMTPAQALELALRNEALGRDFYARVATDSTDAEVRRLAAEMAAEEQQHVDLLQALMDHKQATVEEPPEDLDPPNIPE